MRAAVASHDGNVLLCEDRSTCAQNWASGRGAFREEKIKRFASCGICDHRKSGRTRAKMTGCGGIVLGTPLRNPFDATDEPSRCSPSQAAIRRTMIGIHRQFGKFSWFTSVTCQASHQRTEPSALLMEIDMPESLAKCGRGPSCLTAIDGIADKKLIVVDHQLRKRIAGIQGERAR